MINKIYLCDVIDGLKNINEPVNVYIIDPPYGIGKNFGNNFDNLSGNEYVNWSKLWLNEAYRTLAENGTIYIFGDSQVIPYLYVSIPYTKRILIWSYINKNSPKNNFWQRSYESIIVIWKNKPIFNLDDIRIPYTELFLKNAAGKKRKGTKGRFSKTGKETTYNANPFGASPRDVINVPALSGGAGRKERFFLCKDCNNIFSLGQRKNHIDHKIIIHETQKPYKLIEKLVKASKVEGGLLVSPFSGTGVDSYVGKKLKMNTIAFDINQDYVKMGELLLEKGYPSGC